MDQFIIKTEANSQTATNKKEYSVYNGDMMSFNSYYRAIHFGNYDKNLTEEFIARWPDKWTLNNKIIDGFCRLNNTSGKNFVNFEMDNMSSNVTIPPKPFRIGDTNQNWKKTTDLTAV